MDLDPATKWGLVVSACTTNVVTGEIAVITSGLDHQETLGDSLKENSPSRKLVFSRLAEGGHCAGLVCQNTES